MNNSSRVTRALLASAALLFTACSDYDKATGPSSQNSTVVATITTGGWSVASLTEDAENKAGDFAGYTFTFTGAGSQSGTVTATKGANVVTGTWSHTNAVTYYGSTSNEAVVLSLGSSSPFGRLSRTWNVVSNTATTLSLTDPEVAENKHLVFARQ